MKRTTKYPRQIVVRVTQEQHEYLQLRAKLAGCSVAHLVRGRLRQMMGMEDDAPTTQVRRPGL